MACMVPQRSFCKSVEKAPQFMDRFIGEADRLHRPSTLISELRKEHQEPSSFLNELGHVNDDKQLLRDELRTLFFAGVDTAAAFRTKLLFPRKRAEHMA